MVARCAIVLCVHVMDDMKGWFVMVMSLARGWPGLHPVARTVKDGWYKYHGRWVHYVECGQGPLLILLHGVPEFWYSWRFQLAALSTHYHVVAIDQPGFNFSQAPANHTGYQTQHLAGMVDAAITHLGHTQATVVGHDTGAWLAWHVAAYYPQHVTRLVSVSVPHPNAMRQALARREAQYAASAYAQRMQQPGVRALFRPWMVGWHGDRRALPLYLTADLGTDDAAITAFYQLNYPREPFACDDALPPIMAPTLVIHGTRDTALLTSSHDENQRWVQQPVTFHALDAGHFVHRECPAAFNQVLCDWLAR